MRLGHGARANAAPGDTIGAATRGGVSTITRYWLAGLLGAVLVVLVALVAAALLWVDREADYVAAEARRTGDMLARELGGRAEGLRVRLRGLSGDPGVRGALRSGDPARLRAAEEALAARIPDASAVRVLPAGGLSGTEPGRPSLSYAGLDLVAQAQRQREVTPLEVHRIGQQDVHLAIAGPVLDPGAGDALGVVHLSLPIAALPVAEPAKRGGALRVLLQQQAGDGVATLDAKGQRTAPGSEPDVRFDVPGTRLQVAVWAAGAEALTADLLLRLLGAFGVIVALLASISLLSARRLRDALAGDYAGMVAMAEDAVAEHPIRRIRCRLAESEPVAEVLGRMLRDLSRRYQDAQQASPAQQPAPPGEAPADFAAPRGAGPGYELTEVEADSVRAELAGATQAPPPGDGPMDLGGIEVEEVLPAGEAAPGPEIPAHIFRAYDIRGVVAEDLTVAGTRQIGRAIGSEVIDAGEQRVFVGRDTRPSGVELSDALAEGLRQSGCQVTDLGVVPTPILYFATRFRGDAAGVMVTGSHNPPEYNGLKVVIGGASLGGEQIAELRRRILQGRLAAGEGSYEVEDVSASYVAQIQRDIAVARSMRLVVDCGNGAAATVAGELYRKLDCEVIEIACEPEAGFPGGRAPDPTREESLHRLQQAVLAEQADLGLAFDGDGDRLGVVDSSGKIIWTDRVLMLLAADVLSRHPGTDILYDVKSSHLLAAEIRRSGGRPVMWRSGHSPLKAKLAETGALLAGEWSGHIMFRERWYGFDDALYAGARLVEVLALDARTTAEVFAGLPEALSTPELILPMAEGEPERVMAAVSALEDRLQGVTAHRIDGLRVEHERGWGLVRASNTRPALVFRFEAENEAELERIESLFRKIMRRAAPELALPF